MDDRSFGPFQVNSVDSNKGNVEIQIAPQHTLTVKQANLRLSSNQNINLDNLYQTNINKPIVLQPTKLNEIILLKEIDKFPNPELDLKKPMKPDLSKLTAENLVGKRIREFWKSDKKWYSGTIIGYTSNHAKNLIYYDIRTDEVDPAVDYYAEPLLTDKRLVWEILN